MTRRVAITGIGIISSIGNDKKEVTQALQEAKSGISYAPTQAEKGFRSHVAGDIKLNFQDLIPKRTKRFMGQGAMLSYLAMKEALDESGLTDQDISNPKTGLVVGTGGASSHALNEATKIVEATKSTKKVGPFSVPKVMGSSNSANLAVAFNILGHNYTISSACATSTHCIGHAGELIQSGKQDIVIAGGGDGLEWELSCMFDAMGALSSKYNDTPKTASRAFDVSRDGFVISAGAGIMVLEELDYAKKRGAEIYAELIGYGATSDGGDMVQPSGEGAIRCMKIALKEAKEKGANKIDYINPHATSTPVGDTKEAQALKDMFGASCPPLSATKSLTGHSLGAAGAHEAIYSLLMMKHNFLAKSAHIKELDPACEGLDIIRETRQSEVKIVMSNSFGFGGTNGTLVFGKV